MKSKSVFILLFLAVGFFLAGTSRAQTVTYDHDTVSTGGHCPEGKWARWWYETWNGQKCEDRDDRRHYLKPCRCYCNSDGECSWERASSASELSGGKWDEASSESCGSRGGINDHCGQPVTGGPLWPEPEPKPEPFTPWPVLTVLPLGGGQ